MGIFLREAAGGAEGANPKLFHRMEHLVWWTKRKERNDIVERLETLERAMRALQLDWDDAYDKMRTLTARFTKRAEQIEKHGAQTQLENGSPTGSTTGTSRLDPVSQRILDRRAKLFPSSKESE
jgi:phage shock protein A